MIMGTISFKTDKPAGAILQEELCAPWSRIRMFTTSANAACVALRVDLTNPCAREAYSGLYEFAEGQDVLTVAVIVKHSGLTGRGLRTVSLKVMGEWSGPYYTGGANAQLLRLLSPLNQRDEFGKWAARWRAEAWERAERRGIAA